MPKIGIIKLFVIIHVIFGNSDLCFQQCNFDCTNFFPFFYVLIFDASSSLMSFEGDFVFYSWYSLPFIITKHSLQVSTILCKQ